MQGPGAWPVCSKVAGLTRANGGAASTSSVASRSSVRSSVAVKRSAHGLSVSKVKRLQRIVGARVDGIVGPETTAKTERYFGLTRTCNTHLSGKSLNKAINLVG